MSDLPEKIFRKYEKREADPEPLKPGLYLQYQMETNAYGEPGDHIFFTKHVPLESDCNDKGNLLKEVSKKKEELLRLYKESYRLPFNFSIISVVDVIANDYEVRVYPSFKLIKP